MRLHLLQERLEQAPCLIDLHIFEHAMIVPATNEGKRAGFENLTLIFLGRIRTLRDLARLRIVTVDSVESLEEALPEETWEETEKLIILKRIALWILSVEEK